MEKRVQLRWGDFAIAAAVLAAAIGMLFWHRAGAVGNRVTVTTPFETRTVSLDTDTVLTVDGHDGMSVTVQVADGAVFFVESDCPDHLCVKSGKLTKAGATAACVPAGVMLRVDGEAEVDAVAG